jgi:hypothetical protein
MPDNNDLKLNLEKICDEITPENASDKQRLFSELWKKYVLDVGYDEFAEKTLIDAYLCNSINYWKDVWKKQKQGDVFFKKLLSGKRIKSKERGTLVVLLGVLSICINELDTAGKFIGQVLQLLGNVLPEMSDFNITEFEERFLKRIKERNLDELDINVPSKNKKVLAFFKEVRKLYSDECQDENSAVNRAKLDFVISLMSVSKKKKKNESLPEQKTEEKNGPEANDENQDQTKELQELEKKKNESLPEQKIEEKNSPETSDENQDQTKKLQELEKKYKLLIGAKKELERELADYKELFKQSSTEWKNERMGYEKQKTALQNSLEKRRLDIEKLNVENQNLKTEIERKTTELAQKDAVVQEKDRSIRILKESSIDRFEEKMKSIRERLAIYYGAFQDCREQQMSEDLGYVMRGYLNDVFEIIMDNEMNLNQQ